MRAATLVLMLPCVGCHMMPHDGLAVTAQRPTLSSDTATTAVGSLELEAGGVILDDGGSAIPLSLKYGASESTEVFAGWAPYLLVDTFGSDTSGIGDLSVGVRHRIADETDGRPSLAIQPTMKLPTADEDRDLGTGEVDFLLAGIATKSVEDWTLTGFAQLDFLGDPDGGFLFGQSVAAAVARPLPDRFGVFGEIAGVFVPELDSEQVFTTLGVTYNPYRFLVFDVGVVVGLNEDTPDFGVVFGFTQNLGRVTGGKTQ